MLAVAVVAAWVLAMVGIVVGGARDRRRRRARVEPARQAAFLRSLDARLPRAPGDVAGAAGGPGALWRSWDDGVQVRILPPGERPAGPPARPDGPPSVVLLPGPRPPAEPARPRRRTPHVTSAEPVRSGLPPV